MKLTRAVELVKKYNQQGIAGSLSFLAVVKNSPVRVAREVSEYSRILAAIKDNNLDCDITIKIHQLGIYGREGLAEESLDRIAAEAKNFGNFVWVDMERPDTVDATIEIFRELEAKYGNLGICLQAYLKRSERDLRLLTSKKVPVRLVKGFYRQHDFRSWDEVNENYLKLMEELIANSRRPAIATHDVRFIEKAKKIIQEKQIKNAEFQFFQGVRDDLAKKLALGGFKVRIYVPYGNTWRFLLKGLRTFDLVHQIERMLGFVPW